MYAILQASFKELKNKSGLTAAKVALRGFHGNHETEYLTFAQHLRENKRVICQIPKDLDCHRPMVPTYRRTVDIYEEIMRYRIQSSSHDCFFHAEDIWRVVLA